MRKSDSRHQLRQLLCRFDSGNRQTKTCCIIRRPACHQRSRLLSATRQLAKQDRHSYQRSSGLRPSTVRCALHRHAHRLLLHASHYPSQWPAHRSPFITPLLCVAARCGSTIAISFAMTIRLRTSSPVIAPVLSLLAEIANGCRHYGPICQDSTIFEAQSRPPLIRRNGQARSTSQIVFTRFAPMASQVSTNTCEHDQWRAASEATVDRTSISPSAATALQESWMYRICSSQQFIAALQASAAHAASLSATPEI